MLPQLPLPVSILRQIRTGYKIPVKVAAVASVAFVSIR
jgi:hypothetical protein